MRQGTLSVMLLALLAGFFLSPSEAHARRGIVVITSGDHIAHVANFPSEAESQLRQETGHTVQLGYYYSHFGVFWVDIWTWGGTYCVYEGDNYEPLEYEQAVALMGGSSISKPFFYSCPPGMVLLLCVGVWYGVSSYRERKQTQALQEEISRIAEDHRYQSALKLMQDQYTTDEAGNELPPEQQIHQQEMQGPAVFEKAVQHLVDQGIPREEAERNLALLLAVMSHHG